MADAGIIRQFLVDLGFNIDEAGLRRFNTQLTDTHHVVRDFALTLGALATGIEEAIRRTARQFESLFYLSQQTQVSANSLKTLQFAFGQIGLSASDLNQTFASFTSALMDNPGLRAFVNNYVPGFRNAEDALKGVASRYRDIVESFGAYSAQAAQFRVVLRTMHLDPDMVLQYARNFQEANKWELEANRILAAFGLNSDTAAKQARDAMNAWRLTWFTISTGVETFIVQTFPDFKDLLTSFSRWLSTDGAAQVKVWVTQFRDWLNDKENIEDVKQKLISIGGVLLTLAKGVGDLVDAFVWLGKHGVGPLEQIALAVFGVMIAKAGLTATAIWGVNTAATATVATMSGLIGLIGRLGPIGAFLWGMSPSETNRGEKEALERGVAPPGSQEEADRLRQQQLDKERGSQGNTLFDQYRSWARKLMGQPDVGTGGQDQVIPSGPVVPGAKKSAFTGGDSFGDENYLLVGFYNWWRGDTAFRPIVVISDEYYGKFRDMLRDLFGLNQQSGVGGGGGAAGGGGVVGGHRTGGRFGGMAGGGTGVTGGARVPDLGAGSRGQQAMDYFTSQGWTREQAAGIVANLSTESNLRTNVPGDAGAAIGIAQWHPDRQANFRRVFGKDVRQATYAEQLAFVQWELTHTEAAAGQALRGAKTAQAAGASISRLYERPRDVSSNMQLRGSLAERIAGGYTPGGTVKSVSGGTGSSARDIDAAIGDSIAVGLSSAAHVSSDAIGGTTPRQIYDRVSAHIRDFAGKTVALASGSNPNAGYDENQLGYVHKTLQALHQVGANVVLLGVGRGVRDFARINSRLGQFAGEFHDPFTGELEGTEGGRVHPRSYRYTHDQVRRALHNVDSKHEVNINVHGANDPHGVARAVKDAQDRHSLLHARNIKHQIA